MQNNQNLWIGLIIGSGLTGLLMYVLYQQAGPFGTSPSTTIKTTPVTTPFVKPEPFTTTKTEPDEPQPAPPKPANTDTIKKPAVPQQSTQDTKTAPETTPVSTEDIHLPGIPKNPRLPEKELAKLSTEERKKYEEVLTTYHQVRDKVLKLHHERQQLEQQINNIIKENTTIDQELDEMRQDQKYK